MVRMNEFIARHFEKILVILILVTAFAGTYFVEEKFVVLNFYYLPVLVASYFLGRRMGILISVFSILSVLFFVFIIPGAFLGDQKLWSGFALLSAWSGFLILASIAVGTLYEQNERRLLDVKNAYIGILEILSKYLESSDRYTRGHSIRVSELAMEIAIAMELPRLDVENIRVAGLLHDLGKIEISGEILRKAADLGVEQGAFSDAPSVRGTRLLASVGSVLKEVVPIVVAHQKYFMSSLEADEEKEVEKIPMPVRVIAVADAYDTLMSNRPYRKAMAPSEALEEIVAKAGKQFDPGVVEAFKLVFQKRQKESEAAS